MQDNVVDQLRRMAEDDKVSTKSLVQLLAAVTADMHDNQYKANLSRIANKKEMDAQFLKRDESCAGVKKEMDGRLDVLESRDKKSIAFIAGGAGVVSAIITSLASFLMK